MRTIDADYLKNLPFERLIHTDFGDTAIPIEEIDNAPTVDTAFKEIVAYECGQKSVQRPHGEWLITDSYPHRVYCNKCFKTYAHENWEVWKEGSLPRNFCPNCGADMRKEEEDG